MTLKKKNIRDSFSSLLSGNKEISPLVLKKTLLTILAVLALAIFFVCYEVYMPLDPESHQTVIFTVQKGWGDDEIADNLKDAGLIRSTYFFKLYGILALKHSQLKAGEYNLSQKLSIHDIASKMAQGDIIRGSIVILEGWNIQRIGQYLESKDICTKDYFVSLTEKDYSNDFDFLADKPKSAGLEGYLFPDTYEISKTETCEDILDAMLQNFGKKLTPELRTEITNQKKSIYDVVTMASLIEKEVRTLDDKKIVSGILWKRLAIDMPLQVDATIIYITGETTITSSDKKIDSPYNTYMYNGLPIGPISNSGIASITAAIYPKKTNYWYYLSDGKTIFSETLEQHNAAKAKYLGS